jgi:hypothetical protein
MKELKKLVAGLLGLTLLLSAYGIWATVRVKRLEERLNKLGVSYHELQIRHRAIAGAVMPTDPLSAAQAKVDALRDSLGVPPATVIETHPTISEVNSIPHASTGK